jgi:hypothetical protein
VGKDWTVATDGARFNPFPDKDGDNVPTIYAATTYEAAALESVFHQVPHIQTPEIMRERCVKPILPMRLPGRILMK